MPLTRIKTKGLGTSVTFENITDTGTEGTKVAVGTTAQRGSTTGQWRYNTTTNFFEGRATTYMKVGLRGDVGKVKFANVA